ncbi:hypothetical protein AB5I39_08080 [Sphingomonas sp. MMS24-J45]|uniref:hypothetical protein n=1 Tax=Sphingomonas sp. MMS24-J45 TaxID=3238806 RepID=UPI00384C39CC
MSGQGRPLRFLGIVLGGWIGVRVVLLWPTLESPAAVLRAIAPVPIAAHAPPQAARLPVGTSIVSRGAASIYAQRATMPATPRRAPNPTRVALALLGLVRFGDLVPDDPPEALLPGLPRTVPVTPAPRTVSRWSGSAWLVARGGAGVAPGGLGGQLGGSQAGARLAYLIDRRRRIALAARATTPLGPGLREAAVGVEWQPTRLPVRIVAEQRFALNGGRGGPALGVVGGIDPVALPRDFRLEAYAQAGVIRRATTEPYADGAVRIVHPLGTIGGVPVELGAGAWGGAQRGAARLDLGPSVGVSVPLGKQRVRVMLDWRQRVAGAARPGSGAALTLGTDF